MLISKQNPIRRYPARKIRDFSDRLLAGNELAAIYGDLLPRSRAPAPSYRIFSFDQTEFAPLGASGSGLSDTGYIYVPRECELGAAQLCRLHVVLHGCKQSAEMIADDFYTKIGVNEWADANKIIVLYPQAHATTPAELADVPEWKKEFSANPNGCWNWWGFNDDTQYLTKKGVQLDAIWKMVERIVSK